MARAINRNPVRTKTWNPPALFKSGGYIVVKTYTDGRQEFTDHIDTLEQAREFRKYFLDQNEKSLKYRGRSLFSSVEILPHTAILKNPPLSSHGSSIKTKRTHGLSLAEMRALYKLVKQGNSEADRYARKKLEVPYSETKVQLLAVIDHHIRDLADVKKNPPAQSEVLSPQEIIAEYRKGGEGQGAKLMFISKPLGWAEAMDLARKIGNYNEYNGRKVYNFIGRVGAASQHLTPKPAFYVGREYSPVIYVENIEPYYAKKLMDYARTNLKAEEIDYSPVARRIRLWWD